MCSTYQFHKVLKMNIDDVCRICSENTSLLLNIFNGAVSTIISTKIMTLTNVEIHPNDGLPSSICRKCNNKLDKCIEFINLCKLSDYNWRNKINNIKEQKNDKTYVEFDNNINGESNLTHKKDIVHVEDDSNVVQINDDKIAEKYCDSRDQRTVSQKQQCFTCGKIMSSRFRLKTHLATHLKEKPHTCSFCKKKFTIVENLNTHMRTHTGEKPYSCATCGEMFAQSSGLIVHKRKHSGQTPYLCTLCPSRFKTLANYRYHIRVHTGERKFDCSTCGRAFITRGDLKQHLVTHSGEKPHVCCVCGMRFSRASNLKRHTRYLHNEENKITCEQCPSKFTRKSDLAKHEKCHKNKTKKD